jgi:hypothetical protein
MGNKSTLAKKAAGFIETMDCLPVADPRLMPTTAPSTL